MNTAMQKRSFLESMPQPQPQKTEEEKTVKRKTYVEALIEMFLWSAWLIAFTFTVYEMAEKGIW